MPSRLQPAILGGLFIGVLSALPIISMGNCCCLWVIGGGIIAAYLTQTGTPTAITIGDGAIAGLSAGLVGSVVNTILVIPIQVIMGPWQTRIAERILESAREVPDSFRVFMQPGELGAAGFWLRIISGFFIMLIVSAIFATIGGMVGAAIFNRDKPKVIEPPAQQ